MIIFKTDLHCTDKNEFAYFIKVKGKLICIASTHYHSFWELTEPAEIEEVDLVQISKNKFFNKSNYYICKQKLSETLIELLLDF